VMLRIGDPIAGYLDVESTASQLAAIGLREEQVGQAEFVSAVQSVGDEEVEGIRAEVKARGWIGEPDAMSVRVAAGILVLVERYGALGGTVNCHGPLLRFGEEVGVCACLGVSLATARGTPFSCTGDQPTAIALAIGRKVAGAALYSEMFAPELATGLVLVSNGGEGDPAWASGPVTIAPSLHYPGANGRGASLYFQLEPSPCTFLSVTPSVEGWRGTWAHAEIVESRYPRMMAPNAMIRFSHEPDAGAAIDRWTMAGAVHHQALLRGHHSDELTDVLATCGINAIQAT
jgi:L-arabinose isomerase